MKKAVFIFFFILLFGLGWFPHPIFAVDCSVLQADSAFTLKADCRFGESVDGLDLGTGAANTSKLIIPTGKTLTLLDRGSNPQTLIVGSFTVEDGATIIKPEGSKIIIGQPVCMTDADNDGYIDNGVQTYVDFHTTPGATCIRKETYQEGTHADIVDCAPVDATKNISCLTSADTGNAALNRITDTGDPSLQNYYQEIGKDNGLVGLWHMNETVNGSCTGSKDVCDSSGRGNNGTVTGTTIVNGRIKKGRYFAGSASHIITVSDTTDFTFGTGDFTTSVWVNPTTVTADYEGIFGTYTGTDGFVLTTSVGTDGHLGWWNTTNGWLDTGYALPVGVWSHIAVTRTSGTLRIYVNGVVINTTEGRTGSIDGGDLIVGGWVSSRAYFTGSIDELALWKRALSPEEVNIIAHRRPYGTYTTGVFDQGSAQSSMTYIWTWAGVGTRTYSSSGVLTSSGGETPYSTTGLVAQWNFNSTSGITATNDGGVSSCGGTASNCNGTLTNFTSTSSQDQAAGTGWTQVNKEWGTGALMFDGTNDYVSIPDRDALDITGAITVAAWVRPLINTSSMIINKLDTGSSYQGGGYEFALDSGKVTFWKANGVAGGGACASNANWDCVTSNTTIPIDQWSYVVVVWTGSTGANQMKIYINGVLDKEATANQSTTKANTYDLWIGESKSNSARIYKGVMDSASVYSRVLSAEEVMSNYNAGSIEMQWRAGSTTTPDSTDYAAGTNWTQWAPVDTAGYESQLDVMDTTVASWYWDMNSAGSADGTTATFMPKTKVQDTTIKTQGTGSLKLTVGQPQKDINTVALWHLDDTDSGTGSIKDSSGKAHHGTATGTTVVDGFYEKGRHFAGSASDSITVSDTTDFTFGTGDFSVSVWINPSVTTTNYEGILGTYNGGITAGFILTTSYTTDGHLGWWNTTNGWLDTGYALPVGVWSHIAVTRTSGTLRIYVNGVVINTTEGRTGSIDGGNLTIGGWNDTYPFTGVIDEIRLDKSARTADDIVEAYRAGRDHRLSHSISSSDLTSKTKLPFWVASDRLGTFAELTVGESAFANYEPDANTVGLWHLEEQTGTDAYIKDSSGTNHGTPTGTTAIPGKIGRGVYLDGTTTSLISIPASSSFNFGTGNFTVSSWINIPTEPTTYMNLMSTIASTSSIGWVMSTDNEGDMGFWMAGGGWTLTTVNVPIGWHYWTVVRSGTTLYFYLDGVLRETATGKGTDISSGGPLIMGSNSDWGYRGIYYIDEARVDNIARSAPDIRQAYEIGLRTHPITIDFRATLVSGALIDSTSDFSFFIDETAYGSSAKASHLFVGDKIIVKETVGGVVYIAQGTVSAVTSNTGAVTVATWDTGSTVPSGGFTVNATVFKWQREWMDLTGIPVGTGTGDTINAKDTILRLTMRFVDASQGVNFWLDDMRAGGPYLISSPQTFIPATPKQYIQFRSIFSSPNTATSSSFLTIMKPTLTPTPTP